MRIITPSRLHLGFIDPVGRSGRIYGSVGVALSYPNWELVFSHAEELTVSGGGSEVKDKVFGIVRKVKDEYGVDVRLRIEIVSAVPLHKGLGAGTQLSLAVAEGVLKMLGLPDDRETVVRISGRGRRSGVGIASYFGGGFNLDSGKKVGSSVSPLSIFHLNFPDNWKFLVVLPSLNLNIHGKVEDSKIGEVSGEGVEEVSLLVLMNLLPSLIEGDIAVFGESITSIQKIVGKMFSRPQEGVFAHPVCEALIDFMVENGAYGAGQSSWGPVVYGLVEEKNSLDLKGKVRRYIQRIGVSGDVWVVRVDNNGRRLVGG
ncbi:MAG: hypothetical protein J7L41_05820 [Synergistetes bacterium]|nr:hypothetical protein [Synergistota bacterium]